MPLQPRANVVCVACHSRKVKCDLKSSPDGVCDNCRRLHQTCTQRHGVRKRKPERRQKDPSIHQAHKEGGPTETVGAESSSQNRSTEDLSHVYNNFVSHCSAISYGDSMDATTYPSSRIAISQPSPLKVKILELLRASPVPKPGLIRAWADAYMTHAFHLCPVIEQQDISGLQVSVLLQHGICLVGNLMRHDASGPKLAEEFYEKTKVLIALNHETDQVQILKTLCLMTCWHGSPSNPVSLDGPWQWVGVAVRMIVQMGLHRESTYVGRHDAGCLRRIFWQLQNSDSLQVATWGCPAIIRRKDFDVKLPTLQDFEIPGPQSLLFVENTKLCTILSSISDLHAERRYVLSEEFIGVEIALCEWMSNLPPELQLFDQIGQRNPYWRPVSELFIQYFVIIILTDMLKRRNAEGRGLRRMSVSSLLAASCAVALYDELQCRDDTLFLPHFHGFFCLAIALPLLHYSPQSPTKVAGRSRDLGVLRSVIQAMRGRYEDSGMVLEKLNSAERSIEGLKMQNQGQKSTMWEVQESCIHANELFPFPPTFCDNMDMLEQTLSPAHHFATENYASLPIWPPNESNFDFSFMDLFTLDNGDPDITLGNDGLGTDINDHLS